MTLENSFILSKYIGIFNKSKSPLRQCLPFHEPNYSIIIVKSAKITSNNRRKKEEEEKKRNRTEFDSQGGRKSLLAVEIYRERKKERKKNACPFFDNGLNNIAQCPPYVRALWEWFFINVGRTGEKQRREGNEREKMEYRERYTIRSNVSDWADIAK